MSGMNEKLENYTEELNQMKRDSSSSNIGKESILEKIANKILHLVLFLVISIILFFPYIKFEYTIGNEKTILCYNPISKICITMELIRKTEEKESEFIEYYTIETKGSGFVNILKEEDGNKIFCMNYGGLRTLIFSEKSIKDFVSNDFSVFTVVKNYFSSTQKKRFLEKIS